MMRRQNSSKGGTLSGMAGIVIKRVCAGICMLLLIAWAPWWAIVIATLVFLFVYNSYYEIIIWGLCLDELYGASYSLPYALSATVIACLVLVGVFFLKKRLAFYQ
jgi:hypothetical protein